MARTKLKQKQPRSRKTKPTGFVMTPYEESTNLSQMVAMLNDDSGPEKDWQDKSYGCEDVIRLRRIVRAWQAMLIDCGESGPTLGKMKLGSKDRADLEQFTKSLQLSFSPDGTLRLNDHYPHPYDPAAIQFTRFIRNSQRWRLGGPCPAVANDKICGKWFIKKTRHKRIFCFGSCEPNVRKARARAKAHRGTLARVIQAVRYWETGSIDSQEKLNQLMTEYSVGSPIARKIRLIGREIETYKKRWSEVADCDDWKECVSHVTGISRNFLTLAVNNGELTAPKGRRHLAQ